MTPYELMLQLNYSLIKGEALTEADAAVRQLLSARSTPETAKRFYRGVRYPGNIDTEGRRMYPAFYIPPYNNGKKLKTLYGQTPKTHILAANMYELEILRLLAVLAPEEPAVREMTGQTLERLNIGVSF